MDEVGCVGGHRALIDDDGPSIREFGICRVSWHPARAADFLRRKRGLESAVDLIRKGGDGGEIRESL